jgi:acetoin utilization deacetylase AcuC-like enzyme
MAEYGIEIPITASNDGTTIEHLLANPRLAETKERWLYEIPLEPITHDDALLAHEPAYVKRLFTDGGACEREVMKTFELVNDDGSFHRYEPRAAKFGLEELRDQSLRLAAGTSRGAELALDSAEQFCFYLGGGMHHGQYDFGEGFCLVKDLVIAVRRLQRAGRIGHAWIVDVDAHKGDGTAALTVDDESISTLSVHMASGWPLDQPQILADGRPNPSFTPSTIDVPIESGEEQEYVPRMVAAMELLEERVPTPDFVLVVDGADPYERDQLPSTERLKMPKQALLERDLYLYRWVRKRSIPALFVMAGNYGYHSWEIYSQCLERALLETA